MASLKAFMEARQFYIAIAVILSVAFLLAWLITPLMRRLAIRFGIIDKPNSAVKTHKVATPYMGGLAMLTAVMVTCLGGAIYLKLLNFEFAIVAASMLFLSIMGFVDDVRNLRPLTRFVAEIIIALIIVFAAHIHLDIVYLPAWVNYALTVLWIVGLTNALNIIDIMDGLASGVAVISGLSFLFIGLATPEPQPLVYLLCAAIVGAAQGFWLHNFFPAKIYMGDSGAYLLGFTLAIISIKTEFSANNALAVLTPVLVLGVPIYDTFLVMILRSIKGKNPFHGSKDHFALRLEALKIPRRYVVIFIYHVCIILGMAAFVATLLNLWGALFVYCLISFIALMAGRKLSQIAME